ncbi:SGNH/GDSL hydrolase family protein [Amycolatopsis pigmentata]|uniref:SGNH/GDSL hydrolase family protein n=1 Tax=Amycolatopsis pigmentata TaxID=450801 RepID=A0ABW5G9G9_9PSEU
MTKKTPTFVLGLAGSAAALLLTAACSGQSSVTNTAGNSGAGTDSGSGPSGQAKVLFVGDSVALGESQALAAAAAASKLPFQSVAEDGGGNVVGPNSDEIWKELSGKIDSAKPSVVVYQITTYDWGSEQEQKAAYTKLVQKDSDIGAKTVFVTMPPIKADDFYQSHMADLNRTTSVARKVADDSSGKAALLDAGAVWGDKYQQIKDGKADRSSDGIHTCPQGAARFSNWLLTGLAKLIPGLNPAPAASWANTGWAADKHFTGC